MVLTNTLNEAKKKKSKKSNFEDTEVLQLRHFHTVQLDLLSKQIEKLDEKHRIEISQIDTKYSLLLKDQKNRAKTREDKDKKELMVLRKKVTLLEKQLQTERSENKTPNIPETDPKFSILVTKIAGEHEQMKLQNSAFEEKLRKMSNIIKTINDNSSKLRNTFEIQEEDSCLNEELDEVKFRSFQRGVIKLGETLDPEKSTEIKNGKDFSDKYEDILKEINRMKNEMELLNEENESLIGKLND